MKNIIFAFAISAISLTACNNSSEKSIESSKTNDQPAKEEIAVATSSSPVGGLLQVYLKMKNDLAKDDDKAAADAGRQMFKMLNDFDKSSLKEADTNAFDDIAEDAKEHAQHIGMKEGNIKHQREHFDVISKDMYDLVKKYGAGQKIYVDFCPMYNDNKGATWLSETTEIQNPYFGKEMYTCGEVKEVLQ
ncbi:MAG: DUF3347 domain-containing protein [Ginsengibacter sp.]